MDKLANMQAFAAVAQTGSFAEASRKLGLANSVISKRVKDLEHFLGAPLFVRTTRKVNLTETGYSYLEYVRKTLDEMEEVESQIRDKMDNPKGLIRLAAPLSFGVKFLGPALASYLEKYPGVSIKTYLSDRQVDLIEEGYDLAIRVGNLEDSSLIAKKLLSCRRVVCATPAYLDANGRPQKPEDLKDHNCLSYLGVEEGKSWPFMVNGKEYWQSVSGQFQADNGDLLHKATLRGCGVTMQPTFILGDSIQSGKLEVVLEDYEGDPLNVYAIYQHTRNLSSKVRTLIDHISEDFKKMPSAEN